MIVSKKEFLSNILSVRLLLIVSVFSVIVVGVSYGISIESFTEVERENLLWAHSVNIDNDGIEDDMVIYYTDYWGQPLEDKNIYIYDLFDPFRNIYYTDVDPVLTESTDEYGRIFIQDIRDFVHREPADSPNIDFYYVIDMYVRGESIDETIKQRGDRQLIFRTTHNITRDEIFRRWTYYEFRKKYLLRDLEDKDSMNDVLVHAVTPSGVPSKNAVMYFNESKVASANKYGMLEYEFPPGNRNFTIEDEYGSKKYSYNFLEESELPFYRGPNYIVGRLSLILTVVIPIISIGLAYDSIAKERENKSMFFLLIRPIRRWKIALGKFLGSISAIAIPVSIVNLISLLVIWDISGISPSFDLVLIFLTGSLVLLAIYITIQMLISSVAKSSGTAILGGIGVWMFFNVFFRLVKLGLSGIFNLKKGSYGFEIFSNRLDLLNPNFLFMKIILIFSGRSKDFIGLENWYIYGMFLVWMVVPIILLLYLFEMNVGLNSD